MARVEAIFQPLHPGHIHADILNDVLALGWPNRFILSSAFVNSAGAVVISNRLRAIAANTTIYIGVRNGSSTAQGIAALIATGARVFAVDTATRYRIFHPKIFVARDDNQAEVIIGSANLTHAGLHNNIEGGARLHLDLNDPEDLVFLQGFEDQLDQLPLDHPNHCYEISGGREVINMMREGLLEDERDQKTSTVSGKGSSKAPKPKLNLPYKAPSPSRTRKKRAHPAAAPAAPGPLPSGHVPHFGALVWRKPNLPRGDVQLLQHGHSSGVLRLTQAHFKMGGATINQTTYFRHDVFGGLNWTIDPGDPGKEVAQGLFSVVVEGVYVGDFSLKLSHKGDWEAGQGNYTTGLHWGDAKPFISKEGLIGRDLQLYEPAVPNGAFIIEID